MALSRHDDVPQGVTGRHAGLLEPDKQAAHGVALAPNEFHQPNPYAQATNEGLPGGVVGDHKPTRRNHIGSTTRTVR